VQEIADALEGTDKIVLVKNPVNPDLALWLGGIERLYSADIKNLGVIHRGFSTYEKTRYRNNPEWQIAIELQNRFPDLPLICDPSHITGNREMIQEVSQTALDLNFDGLMIETHFDPANAWSDAAQQVTPTKLKAIMEDLKIKKEELVNYLPEEVRPYVLDKTEEVLDLNYPVNQYPSKVKSLNIIKSQNFEGVLKGVKGQYLIFEGGTVFNVRNNEGLVVSLNL
jgi:hypothetical protein